MDLDRILYIFGSFTRKKQGRRKSFDQVSLSAGNSPLHLPRVQRPMSQNLNIAPRTSAYVVERNHQDEDILKECHCGICRKEIVEPRLLGCLHSFCTRCLQQLHQEGESELWNEIEPDATQLEPGESRSTSGSGAGSAGSGYESDIPSDESWDTKPHKNGIFTRKISGKRVQLLLCPICGYENILPLGGISALPINYLLIRKMMAAERKNGCDNILCDLCNSDNKAESRCNKCHVSVCTSCGESHVKRRNLGRHFLHPLDLKLIKRCSQHKAELSVYCATCQQIICRDCGLVTHSGHALANASRAAAERARLLKDACERAKHLPENVDIAVRAINIQALEVDSQVCAVERETREWSEQYIRAVENHCHALLAAVLRYRRGIEGRARGRQQQMRDLAEQARTAVHFTEELLSEASEDELLSLSGPVLHRLEEVSSIPSAPPLRCELRLARTAPASHDSTLLGRLFTHAPDPQTSILNTEGLQDLRVDVRHEATLELRDSSGERIWCGGEQVSGYFRRRDSSARPAMAKVTDRKDGTYSIVFTPPSPGAYLLAVTLNDKPIRGSPFICAVRVSKAHTGRFHCCAFCSSGGKREATCGCGASMGRGYKGCGHGHAGHPGMRHWSCCGSTQRDGTCTAQRNTVYQFSL